MKIPKEIKLMGRRIPIEYDLKISDNDDAYGFAAYRKGKIIIVPKDKSNNRTDEMVNITFLHEIIHWIFFLLHEDDLRNNEGLVSRITEMLYQIIPQIEGK